VRFRLLFAGAIGLISAFTVSLASAQEPGAAPAMRVAPPAVDAPPPGARTTHVVAGAVTTGVAYGLAVGASYLYPDFRGAKQLRVPLVGPWMALARTGCAASEPDCSTASLVLSAALTIFDGVSQAGGLAIIAEGLFLRTAPPRRAAPKAATLTLRPVPMDFGRSGAGVGVVGTF
jgi:hypothetical protein